MDSATQNRLASADISGDQAFVFYETALDGASFLRDFVPAFLIMAVALVLSVWLPVEADTGLRAVESSVGDCRFAVGDGTLESGFVSCVGLKCIKQQSA